MISMSYHEHNYASITLKLIWNTTKKKSTQCLIVEAKKLDSWNWRRNMNHLSTRHFTQQKELQHLFSSTIPRTQNISGIYEHKWYSLHL